MSTTSGILQCSLMVPMALAEALSGTATRTISQPASSKRRICWMVAFGSSVRVLHIDWMETGAPPPTKTLPTLICFVIWYLPLLLTDDAIDVLDGHHDHQAQQQHQAAEVDVSFIFGGNASAKEQDCQAV